MIDTFNVIFLKNETEFNTKIESNRVFFPSKKTRIQMVEFDTAQLYYVPLTLHHLSKNFNTTHYSLHSSIGRTALDAYRGDSNSGTERMWSFCISSIVPIVKEFALESAKLKNIDKNIEALTDKTISFFRREYTYVQETKFSLVAKNFRTKTSHCTIRTSKRTTYLWG